MTARMMNPSSGFFMTQAYPSLRSRFPLPPTVLAVQRSVSFGP